MKIDNIVKDYLWAFELPEIDNKILRDSCLNIEGQLKEMFPAISEEQGYGSFTTHYHKKYNLFSFRCTELHKLYSSLSKTINLLVNDDNYYIRCWVNIFRKGENISWHNHWEQEYKTYHGYYCVNTEGKHESYTDYVIPNELMKRITSKDGLCVFGKSQGDRHKTYEWNNEGERITIAFDVIPFFAIRNNNIMHNYLPILK